MASWMDFLGKGYYTIPKFINEAKQYGITRRVGMIGSGAAKMSWGDTVICLQKEGKSPSYSVICEFTITRFVGVSEPARKLLASRHKLTQLDNEEEETVDRECGSYEIESSWEIEAPLSEIAKQLQKAKQDGLDVGKVMIGCWPEDITWESKPYPKIGGFDQKQGFRAYNREKYRNDIAMKRLQGKRLKVKGTYYTQADVTDATDGIVQQVKGYTRKEDMDKATKLGQLVLL